MTAHKLALLMRSAVLFIVVAWSPLVSTASVAAQGTVPVLELASLSGPGKPGATIIRGDGFTPEGKVFIAVLDPWGERSYETRWVTASAPTFDMLGHDDPALGYRPGGVVLEAFDNLCGQEVMVRAHDKATRSWSNAVDLIGAC